MIHIFRLPVPWPVLCLAVADALILFGVIVGGLALRWTTISGIFEPEGPYFTQALLFVLVGFFYLLILGAFRRQTLLSLRSLAIVIFVSHLLSFVSLTVLFYLLPSTRIWLSTLIPALLVSMNGIFAVHYAFDRLVASRRLRRRVLVLGAGRVASRIARMLDSGYAPMTRCVGYLQIEDGPVAVPEEDVLHPMGPIEDLIVGQNVDEVVVALDERREHLPVDALLQCRLKGIAVTNLSTFLEREEGRVDTESLHPSWMIFSAGFTAATRIQRLIKRAFDILASLVILTVTFPLLAAAALAIVIEDGRPVFYRQDRIGLNGRRFRLLKFRSMRVDAEKDGKPKWADLDDPRITQVGGVLRRARIDELPQLYNVLRGEMSLIGPRPERPEFVEQLEAQIPYYDYRHTVKPGISGWAQINYPYGSSIEDAKEKLKYDLYYIKNYSIFLDLLVLLQTFRVVIWPEKRDRRALHVAEVETVSGSRLDRAKSAP